MVLTTQIGGSYKTNMWSYINDGSICATYQKFVEITRNPRGQSRTDFITPFPEVRG